MHTALEVLWLWLALMAWVAAVLITGAGLGLLSFAALHYLTG